MLRAYHGIITGIPKQQWDAHRRKGCVTFDFVSGSCVYRLGIKGDVGMHTGFIGQDRSIECVLPANTALRAQIERVYIEPRSVRKGAQAKGALCAQHSRYGSRSPGITEQEEEV
jgi:hypothetical protein